MLSVAMLLGGGASFLRSIQLLRREKYFAQVFKDVEKMPIYPLEYIDSLNDLPKDKHIILTGTAQFDKTISAYSDPSIKLLFNTFLPTTPIPQKEIGQGMKVSLGVMYQFKRLDILKFKISSTDKSLDIIPPNKKNGSIILYAIPSFRTDIIPQEVGLKGSRKLTEFGLTEKCYNICGKLNNDQFEPLIIMGESKELFLDYLDQFLYKTSNMAKKWMALAGGFLILNVAYIQALKRKKK